MARRSRVRAAMTVRTTSLERTRRRSKWSIVHPLAASAWPRARSCTRALKPQWAIAMSAVANFGGALLTGTAVAKTVGAGLIATNVEGVSVVAAFQNVSADLLNDTRDLECDVIICTDDPNAREVVTDLVHKIPGLRALDGGALENSHSVEQITALLITLNIRHKSHSAGLRITGLDEPSRRPQ